MLPNFAVKSKEILQFSVLIRNEEWLEDVVGSWGPMPTAARPGLPHNRKPSPTLLALGHLSQRERLTVVSSCPGFSTILNQPRRGRVSRPARILPFLAGGHRGPSPTNPFQPRCNTVGTDSISARGQMGTPVPAFSVQPGAGRKRSRPSRACSFSVTDPTSGHSPGSSPSCAGSRRKPGSAPPGPRYTPPRYRSRCWPTHPYP